MNYQKALKVLGVPDPPTPAEVKRAYRQLALRYHPDRNPDNQTAVNRFREATEAYNYFLKNINRFSQTPPSTPSTTEAPKAEPKPAEAIPTVEDLENIFDDILGFTREDRILGFQDPQDLSLSLLELTFGTTKRAKLIAFEKCSACNGFGAQKNTPATICTYCFGSGQISANKPEGVEKKMCPRCRGKGRRIQKPCLHCGGFGRLSRLRTQEMVIPAGLLPDQVYTLHSKDLKLGRTHDLFIRPRLKQHPVFKVENSDILCEYPVARSVAAKGGIIDFPSIWGWSSFRIPPQSESGDRLCVTNQGLMRGSGSQKRGHTYVDLRVVSDRQFKKLAKKFLNNVAFNNRCYGNEKVSWWKRLFS